MKKNNFSHDRMESEILNILNHTLKNEIYDQKIKMASFTGVVLSNDNSIAKVYVDTYDRSQIDFIVSKLNDAKGVFRTALAKNLTTYKTPKIVVLKDESIDKSLQIEKILMDINDKK